MKFSVLIRTKNKKKQIRDLLECLCTYYYSYVDDIIIVDNGSTEDVIQVYQEFQCTVVHIVDFTYGRAINMGMKSALNNWVLVMSSHCLPVGEYFFKEIESMIDKYDRDGNLAGLRLMMISKSFEAERYYFENDKVDSFNRGILASGAIVSKKVWQLYNFNERCIAAEDKYWSHEVIINGYDIKICPAFYAYRKRPTLNEKLATYRIERYELFSGQSLKQNIDCLKIDIFNVLRNPFKIFFRELYMYIMKFAIDIKNIWEINKLKM